MKQSDALRNLNLAQARLKEVEGQAGLGLSAAVVGAGLVILGIVLVNLFANTWWFLSGAGGILFVVGVTTYTNLHSRTYEKDYDDLKYNRGLTAMEYARERVARAEKDLEESE